MKTRQPVLPYPRSQIPQFRKQFLQLEPNLQNESDWIWESYSTICNWIHIAIQKRNVRSFWNHAGTSNFCSFLGKVIGQQVFPEIEFSGKSNPCFRKYQFGRPRLETCVFFSSQALRLIGGVRSQADTIINKVFCFGQNLINL